MNEAEDPKPEEIKPEVKKKKKKRAAREPSDRSTHNDEPPHRSIEIGDAEQATENSECFLCSCFTRLGCTLVILVLIALVGAAAFAIWAVVQSLNDRLASEKEHYSPWDESYYESWHLRNKVPQKSSVTYYFPFVTENNVTFAYSKQECDEYSDYELAGLAGTNFDFLKRTAHLVDNAKADAVWTGGYFDATSRHPYLVRWANKRVAPATDALKSPKNIWCVPPDVVIPRVQKLSKGRVTTSNLILPIVRTKENSSCLTIHVRDFFTDGPPEQYPSLCMRQRAEVSLFEKSGGEIVLQEFINMFHTGTKMIRNLARLFGCNYHQDEDDRDCVKNRQETEKALDDKYPLRPEKYNSTKPGTKVDVKYDYLLVGYPELMSYDHAKLICERSSKNRDPPNSKIMGWDILESHKNLLDYKKSFTRAEKTYFSLGLPATRGYFLFLPRDFSEVLLWDALDYKHDMPAKVSSPSSVPFNWCNGNSTYPWENALMLLKQYHQEFAEWYKEFGKLTTGPYRVYVTVDLVQGEPCLRLVTDDLYWPGATSWLPACAINLRSNTFCF